jgi:cellobiose transport system permease protein
LDGCSDIGIFTRIILPVIRPALITLFMLFFLWSWNNYLTPLVLINKEKLYTIPLAISLLSSEYRTDYSARILALALSTIPILIMFAFGSKHLIRGLVGGSIKG